MKLMSERFSNSLVSPEHSERAESFNDLHISLGTYLVERGDSDSSLPTAFEVVQISPDKKRLDTGLLTLQSRSAGQQPQYHEISFTELLDQQERFVIDRPELPEGIEWESALIPSQLRDKVETINRRIVDPETTPKLRDQFVLQRAHLTREAGHAALSQIHEVFQPQQGEQLRQLVRGELFAGRSDEASRREAAQQQGYNFDELMTLGKAVHRRYMELIVMSQQAQERDQILAPPLQQELNLIKPLVQSGNEEQPTRHSAVTIGATIALSRQMRKYLLASIAQNPDAVMNGQHASPLHVDDIKEYLAQRSRNPRALSQKQDNIIAGLVGEQKQQQYRFVGSIVGKITDV